MNHAIHLALERALESLDEAARDQFDSMNLSEVSDLIPNCSIAAAVAGVGSGWLPGAGAAVASAVYRDYKAETKDATPSVIVSTASPYKFGRSVLLLDEFILKIKNLKNFKKL